MAYFLAPGPKWMEYGFTKLVDTLEPGNVFRDWLVHKYRDRLHNDKCKVYVKIPASHTVCRYEFKGEDFGVVSKFYEEPTGGKRNYNPTGQWIDSSRSCRR